MFLCKRKIRYLIIMILMKRKICLFVIVSLYMLMVACNNSNHTDNQAKTTDTVEKISGNKRSNKDRKI